MREKMIELVRPWLRLAFWLLLAAIAIFALHFLLPPLLWVLQVLQPFLIALIVAYVFHPIVTFVQKNLHLGRVAGIAVLVLTMAAALIGVLIWLVPVLYQQIVVTVTELSNLSATVTQYMTQHHFDPKITSQIDTWLKNTSGRLRASIDNPAASLSAIKPVAQGSLSAVRSVAGGLFGVVGGVAGFLISTAFVVIITIYYLADMDAFPPIILRLLPVRHRERIWNILKQADQAVGGFLRGQLIACLIVGTLTSILLFFVGMKQYAILIGSFAGVMHLVPYLGPIAGGTPAVLFIMFSQHFASLNERLIYIVLVIVGFSIIETFDGLVTQPFIVGKRASLHPLAVMLALLVGAQLGIGGMIIAVPVMCFARVLWMELFWKYRPLKPAPEPAPAGADGGAAAPGPESN